MTQNKTAQMMDFDGESLTIDDLNDLKMDVELSPESPIEEEILVDGGEVEGEVTVTTDDGKDDFHKEFSFTLPSVPGGEDQSDIEEEVTVDENDAVEVETDPHTWNGKVADFLPYLHFKMHNCPKHTGRDTTGLLRTISYFEDLDKDLTRAARMDTKGILDIGVLEKARDEIQDGIDRMRARYDQIEKFKYKKKPVKKKADDESDDLVKTAQVTSSFGVQVSMFMSAMGRMCINGAISGGHDIADLAHKVIKKYDLTKREQVELLQLLADCNYPVKYDRLLSLDEDWDRTSSDNGDMSAEFKS